MRSILKMVDSPSVMGNPALATEPQATVVARDVCVHYGSTVALAPSTLDLPPASRWRSSGPTAAARARCCSCSPACCDRRRAPSNGAATPACRSSPSTNPSTAGCRSASARCCAWGATASAGCSAVSARPTGGRSPRPPSGWTCGDAAPAVRRALGRSAPACPRRPGARRPPRPAAPRRADHRTRPAVAAADPRRDRRRDGGGHDGRAVDAPSRRGPAHRSGPAPRRMRGGRRPAGRGAPSAAARRGVRQPDDPHATAPSWSTTTVMPTSGEWTASTPPISSPSTITITCTTSTAPERHVRRPCRCRRCARR